MIRFDHQSLDLYMLIIVSNQSVDTSCNFCFKIKGWLAIATLKPLVEREFLSTNEKPGFQRVANQTKLLPSPFFYDVSETNDE